MKIITILFAFLFLALPANAALYALVNSAEQIIDSRDFAVTPPDLLSTQGVTWRAYVDTDPVYDPATQIKTGPVVTVLASTVTRVWTVTNKTAQELDDDKTAQVDAMGEVGIKAALDTSNSWRSSIGLSVETEAQFRLRLKSFIGANPPAPDPANIAVKKGTGAPSTILTFNAMISPTSVAGAAFTDQTFTVTGILTTDTLLSVRFNAGLLPNTISYIANRVSATNTLSVRFQKISTGAITPTANQAITVLVAR